MVARSPVMLKGILEGRNLCLSGWLLACLLSPCCFARLDCLSTHPQTDWTPNRRGRMELRGGKAPSPAQIREGIKEKARDVAGDEDAAACVPEMALHYLQLLVALRWALDWVCLCGALQIIFELSRSNEQLEVRMVF
jgi:hypothetical protein